MFLFLQQLGFLFQNYVRLDEATFSSSLIMLADIITSCFWGKRQMVNVNIVEAFECLGKQFYVNKFNSNFITFEPVRIIRVTTEKYLIEPRATRMRTI